MNAEVIRQCPQGYMVGKEVGYCFRISSESGQYAENSKICKENQAFNGNSWGERLALESEDNSVSDLYDLVNACKYTFVIFS